MLLPMHIDQTLEFSGDDMEPEEHECEPLGSCGGCERPILCCEDAMMAHGWPHHVDCALAGTDA